MDITQDYIHILTHDDLVLIFTYLHGGMILRCGAVCKKWKEASEMDWLWLMRMSIELTYLPQYSSKVNKELNMGIAKIWRDTYGSPLKNIYVQERRRDRPSKRVFPLSTFSVASLILKNTKQNNKKISN
jgi:hypothetical protein